MNARNVRLSCLLLAITVSSVEALCEPLPNPDHGDVSFTSNFAVAAFTCDDGFIVSVTTVASVLTCTGSTWVPASIPTCIASTCAAFPDAPGLTISYSGVTSFTIGTTALFACERGYARRGAISAECKPDALGSAGAGAVKWDAEPPACTACIPGYYNGEGTETCIFCNRGTYSPTNGTDMILCVICD